MTEQPEVRGVNWVRAAMHPDLTMRVVDRKTGAERVIPVDHLPLRVLVCLAAHADENGVCWPGESLIAAMVRSSERRAQIALAELETAALCKRIGRAAGGNIKRQLTLPAFAFERVARDLRKRQRRATPASPQGSTGNTAAEYVHPFKRPRRAKRDGDELVAIVEPEGDAQVAMGRRRRRPKS